MSVRASITLLATLAAGLLGGIVFASPRSESWTFDASISETVSWLSHQATSTAVGSILLVLVYAAWVRFGPKRSLVPMWSVAVASIIVLAFVKVAIPEAASVAVLTALHILKCCAAGVLVGSVAAAVRGRRAGWTALATGLFGGFLLIATQGTVNRFFAEFVPGRPFSSSVFGEPAWWLLAVAVAAAAIAGVVSESSAERPVLANSTLLQLVLFAVVAAAGGRIAAEFIVRSAVGTESTVVSIVAVALFVIVIDVIASRWESSDARVVLAALACTATAVSVWGALTTTGSDHLVLAAAGGIGLIGGAAVAAKAPRLWVGLVLLLVVPTVVSIVRTNVVVVGAVAVAGLGIALTLGSLRIPADDDMTHDDTVRAFALLIPGAALALTAAVTRPSGFLFGGSYAPLTGVDSSTAYETALSIPDDFTATQRTSALLMLAVVLYCSARIFLRRRR